MMTKIAIEEYTASPNCPTCFAPMTNEYITISKEEYDTLTRDSDSLARVSRVMDISKFLHYDKLRRSTYTLV